MRALVALIVTAMLVVGCGGGGAYGSGTAAPNYSGY